MGKVRVGIIGAGFAAQVHAPAFRRDPRCELAAVASGSAERGAKAAAALGVEEAYPSWRALIADESISAVTIAVPPAAQAEIVLGALARGKAVFAEKPFTVLLAEARRMVDAATAAGVANMVDFNFTAVPAWMKAKQRLGQGAIGALRQVTVTWNVETRVNRFQAEHWKARRADGGGALFNFGGHVLHYLEWFGGPLAGLAVRRFTSPGDSRPGDTFFTVSGAFRSGAAISVAVGTAAFQGSGHRVDFYGEEGTLVLENRTKDYHRGFTLNLATRDEEAWQDLSSKDTNDNPADDERVPAVARMAASFLDWVTEGRRASPDFVEASRVQALLEVAQRSDDTRQWLEVE
jgi:predicted dehydrogenase